MNVNTTNAMQQQMQTRKMDGSGQGMQRGGENGMKEIMQSLSVEDRSALKEEMSAIPQEDRGAMVEQLKSVDKTMLSDEEYMQSLLEILGSQEAEEDSSFSVYV